MNTKNYIKVTIDGKSYILLASLENYYRSRGAKIEKASEKEINAAFPEVAMAKSVIAKLEEHIAQLQQENAILKEQIAQLQQNEQNAGGEKVETKDDADGEKKK